MGGTASVSAANLIIAIILTNSKGIEYYGEFVFIQAIFLTYSVIFRPLTWQAIIKYAPVTTPESLINISLKIELLFSIIGAVFFNLFTYFFAEKYFGLETFILSIVFILINNGTLIGFTRAKNSYYYVSFLIVISSISKVVIAITFSDEPLFVFFYMTLTEAVLWFLFLFYKYFQLNKIDDNRIYSSFNKVDFYKFSLWAMLHEILDLPVRHLDKIIVGGFLGNSAVGVLDLVKRISQVVAQFSVPLNAIVFPKYSYLINEKDFYAVKRISYLITAFLSLCSLFIVFVFYMIFDEVNEKLFSNQLLGYELIALGYLSIQLVAVVFVWVHPLSLIIMNMKSIAKIILIANSIYLLTLFLTLDYLGIYAALLAFGIQVFFVINAKLFNVFRIFKGIS
jgi:O-antigen/teichoic acid export membrane protein